MPHCVVVAFFKCVQLVVISAAICIDLRLFIALENTSHGPLTVDKATVTDLQVLARPAAWAPQNSVYHVFFELEDIVTSVDHHELLKGWALEVLICVRVIW